MLNRRRFILKSVGGVVASSFALSGIVLAAQNKRKLGVALVGLGYYSTDLLAPALMMTEHCELRGIVTGTPAKAEQWKKQYNIPDKNIYDYDSMHRVADNADIDVLYIVLPPSMHAKYSIIAANAGKHVWCEKPMAMTVKECQDMIDACNKNKVKLSIGYRMHHEPNTQEIMRFAAKQPYGEIVRVKAEAGYFDPRKDHWKQKKALGGGAMYDMGVYPLNAARYSTGMEPISVTARASTSRPDIYTEVEETMEFDLEFPKNITANCMTSFGKGINELHVDCRKGWYKLEPFQSYSGIKGLTSDGKQLNAIIPNQQAKQMDDDALAIINNRKVMVPGEEGLKDIKVVEAVYRSVAEKRKVKI